MWLVYLLTRDDGKQYVGKTGEYRLPKRMSSHKGTERFKGCNFTCKILYQTDDHDDVLLKESMFVDLYDTFRNGLNNSIDGSGNHMSANFNTLGWTPSEDTRKKMRENHWSKRGFISPTLGKVWTDKEKKNASDRRKGKFFYHKLSIEDAERMMIKYINTPQKETTIARNGRPMTNLRSFCHEHHERYGLTVPGMYKILNGQTLAYKELYERIIKNV